MKYSLPLDEKDINRKQKNLSFIYHVKLQIGSPLKPWKGGRVKLVWGAKGFILNDASGGSSSDGCLVLWSKFTSFEIGASGRVVLLFRIYLPIAPPFFGEILYVTKFLAKLFGTSINPNWQRKEENMFCNALSACLNFFKANLMTGEDTIIHFVP